MRQRLKTRVRDPPSTPENKPRQKREQHANTRSADGSWKTGSVLTLPWSTLGLSAATISRLSDSRVRWRLDGFVGQQFERSQPLYKSSPYSEGLTITTCRQKFIHVDTAPQSLASIRQKGTTCNQTLAAGFAATKCSAMHDGLQGVFEHRGASFSQDESAYSPKWRYTVSKT